MADLKDKFNKIKLGNDVLVDFTETNIPTADITTRDGLGNGVLAVKYNADGTKSTTPVKFYGPDGAQHNATCTFDADTTTTSAPIASQVLVGKEAWANGSKVTGTMNDHSTGTGANLITISGDLENTFGLSEAGYYAPDTKVTISDADKTTINRYHPTEAGHETEWWSDAIAKGSTILGVKGAYEGSEVAITGDGVVQATVDGFEVTPSMFPDYDDTDPTKKFTCMKKIIAKIPTKEETNAGGKMLVIGVPQGQNPDYV